MYSNAQMHDTDCAYNISSIHESASRVASLIDHELQLIGGDHSKVRPCECIFGHMAIFAAT